MTNYHLTVDDLTRRRELSVEAYVSQLAASFPFFLTELWFVIGLAPWAKPYHTLRKNCATDWLSEGLPVMDVCEWLGHDAAVSRKHYHETRSTTIDRVTGRAGEEEASALKEAQAEVQRLHNRIRLMIAKAREAQKAQKRHNSN